MPEMPADFANDIAHIVQEKTRTFSTRSAAPGRPVSQRKPSGATAS